MHAYNVGISWLWSYAWLRLHAPLRSEDMTLVVYLDSGRTSRLQSTSQLRMSLLTPDAHHDSSQWVRHLSYHLSCERLCMAELDDRNILQPEHLIRNELGGTHDSDHSFTHRSSLAMYRMTKEHLACHDLRKNWVSEGTQYPTLSLGSMLH
jgi:hypothetical protein